MSETSARTATIDRAGAWAELDDGGTGKVVTGVTEIGEGILTVLAQVAADEMGIRPEDVTIGDNDTARSPEAAHAGATRQTYMIGNSVALACREARDKLFAEIADHLNSSLPTNRGVIITGAAGTGKTAAVLKLVERSCFGGGEADFQGGQKITLSINFSKGLKYIFIEKCDIFLLFERFS